ncbi:MAG: hypothetical protein OSB25_11420 [Salibacteraceae bacterium]|nr:hypothetical protein [Salibacteraceae bacterium]|tara:strand:- start:4850 stop:5221 length:372 start_codon:yes stop_codon:yes gene_type:complete
MKKQYQSRKDELKAVANSTILVFFSVFISTVTPIIQNSQEEDRASFYEMEDEQRSENKEIKEGNPELKEDKELPFQIFNTHLLHLLETEYNVIQTKNQLVFLHLQALSVPKYILYCQLLLDCK